jgi:hypothetical protein
MVITSFGHHLKATADYTFDRNEDGMYKMIN